MPKGEGTDLITFKTSAALQPHDEPVRPLWRATKTVPSSLRAPWVIIKMTPEGAAFLYPSPIS